MSKVLIVSSVLPFPADNGKKIVLGGFLKYFKYRYGEHSVVWLYVGNKQPEATQSNVHFHTIKLPNSILRLLSVLRYALVDGGKSIQEAILYTNKIAIEVRSQIQAEQPDLIMLDTVRAAQYGVPDEYMNRTVLYMEDLFSVRYQRMIDILNQAGIQKLNVLGNFISFIPAFLRIFIQNSRAIQRGLLRLEKKLIEKSELRCAKQFRLNILLNQDEATLLRKRSFQSQIAVTKPLLPRSLPNSLERRYDGNFNFVFIGGLNYAPNEVAMLTFIEKAMPLIIFRAPDFNLKIIGKNASDKLIAEVGKFSDNIQLMGFVPDLTDLLSKCCGMIVPMTFGTGIKLKTLEALSYGVPIVSTSIGVEGISVVNGTQCIIEDDLTRFPELMLSLRDIKRNEYFSREAGAFYALHYSQKQVFMEYDLMFKNILNEE